VNPSAHADPSDATDTRCVVAILTCFNRKAMTLACLAALKAAAVHARVKLRAILVDDASTDGTAAAVRETFPWVDVIAGPGSLYWNRGMHLGFARALLQPADHYLWLNDDTLLLPDALRRLLDQSQMLQQAVGRPVIVVGATSDASGRVSYGGSVAHSRLKRFTYRPVWSDREPQVCDVMNGNCVLIPHDLASGVGNLDPVFEHAMGDTDYALRARRAGYRVYVAPGIVGRCSNNTVQGTFNDRSLPFAKRWHLMLGRKGLPWRSWLRFTRKHGGVLWPLYFVWPYAKLIATAARPLKRSRGAKESVMKVR
jgi:GT2 family glycosyltransferase